MARKQDGGGDEVGQAEANVRAAAGQAATMAPALVEQQRQGERASVLSAGPIPEVKLRPVQAAAPKGMEDFQTHDRMLLDPNQVAPIVADATLREPHGRRGSVADSEQAQPKELRYFIVLEPKQILDKTSGARTRLPGGKVIHEGHYDIAHLLRQGVKLKKTAKPDTVEGTDDLIDALTS